MQFIDNPDIYSMKNTFVNMIKQERFYIFYKGFFPFINSQIFLYTSVEWSHKLCFEYKIKEMEILWPLLYMTGCILAHLQIVLATKIYCSRFTHPRS
jgi:hypothetical protein